MNFGVVDKGWLLAICVLLPAGHASGSASESTQSHSDHVAKAWTVERVVASLKEDRESSVSFVEMTHSSLLTEPLIARGVLRFIPPSTLEKEVQEPYRERYIIEGDLVIFESERKSVKKTISLEDYPSLRAFVEAIRAAFTGNAAQLKQIYELTLDGNWRSWTLALRPRDASAKSLVDHILLAGSEGRLDAITVRAPDGDRSVITLSPGNPP